MTFAPPLVGGILIGLAAVAVLLFLGRIAGISGILGGLLSAPDRLWRAAFLLGLVAGGAVLHRVAPATVPETMDRSLATLVAAGLLVGYGTRLGSGCTSGHGVCGVARLSRRSLAATAAFMATGMATVAVVRHLLGGQ